MKEIAKLFEDLIRRSLAPSAAFLMIFFVVHLINGTQFSLTPSSQESSGQSSSEHRDSGQAAENAERTDVSAARQLLRWAGYLISEEKSSGFVGTVGLLFFVGFGYILSALSSLLFDKTLKGNFDAWSMIEGEGTRQLRSMRSEIIEKLKYVECLEVFERQKGDFNDYLLYQLFGAICRTRTGRFVDRAKSYGVVVVSFVISFVTIAFVEGGSLRGILCYVFVVCLVFAGREFVKDQYRVRAIRIYYEILQLPSDVLNSRFRDQERPSTAQRSPASEDGGASKGDGKNGGGGKKESSTREDTSGDDDGDDDESSDDEGDEEDGDEE